LPSSTDVVNQTAEPKINDGNPTSTGTVNLDNNTIRNSYQAAGIIWSSAQSGITSVRFRNGVTDAGEGGWFEGEVALQYRTTAGNTWVNSGWSASPSYPNSVSASNNVYTFSGSALPTGCNGIRVVGKVRTSEGEGSWGVWVAEIEAINSSGSKINAIQNDIQQLQLNQSTARESITVYPNPVSDGWLTVGLTSADANNKIDVVLADLSGRVVYKNSFVSNGISERINIGAVQPGIYVIRITGTNTKFNAKVLVQ
jgi:hypothetical protein